MQGGKEAWLQEKDGLTDGFGGRGSGFNSSTTSPLSMASIGPDGLWSYNLEAGGASQLL